jgi:hypothetical protein
MIVGLFGLLGNTLSIIILAREEMRNTFNQLLLALACFDTLFIVFVCMDYTCIRGNSYNKRYGQDLYKKNFSVYLAHSPGQ